MAIMIPSVVSPEVKSNAERKIFEWFQKAPGTDNWIVLHSLGIATHNKVIYGETDFLVLAPKLGVFALEVKGGRVRREGGLWYFTNRNGATNSKERGPFEQAKDGIFSIVDAIKERTDIDHRHINNVLFGYGVMFPDIEFNSSGIEEEQWQVFDSRDGTNVRQFIKRLSEGARAKWEAHYGPMSNSKLPDSAAVRYMADLLRGDFDCAISMSAQLRNASEALIALTNEQYRCLDQLDDNPRCLIHGPAGTGKTLLAQKLLEKYKYPYLSIDHLKMGLIRSGNTSLTPLSDDNELTEYLWPIVREIIKTAIENKQNLIVEGCYIPFDYEKDFTKEYLENIAKSNNEKYYEIVEDTYEYPNGLMLITYNDEKHEDEKEHICIDLDNLQNLDERFLGPSDEVIADSKAKGLYSESAELSYGDLEDLAKDIFDWYDADMGTHFDEVQGNEEVVYGDIMTILETKDQEQIQHFIDDITEADINDDTAKKIKIATTSSLVERLKALLK